MTEKDLEQHDDIAAESVQVAVEVQEQVSVDENLSDAKEPITVEVVDEVQELENKLAEVEAKAAEYLDGWQRSRAEFANFKRRQEQSSRLMKRQATMDVVSSLLPVLDDGQRAFAAIPEDSQQDVWLKGLAMVDRKLRMTLEKAGLSVMEVSPGDEFDPYVHQAVMHEPSEDYGEGLIIEVLQSGYNLDDVVLRPAIVRVSKGALEPQEPETPEDAEEQA